jgi:hypothetical protein
LQRPPPEMRIFSATLAAWSSSSTRAPAAGHRGAVKAGRSAPTITASKSCVVRAGTSRRRSRS